MPSALPTSTPTSIRTHVSFVAHVIVAITFTWIDTRAGLESTRVTTTGRAIMWLDDGGVVHTVAVPDPRDILGAEAVLALSRLRWLSRRRVAARLERDREAFFGAVAAAHGSELLECSPEEIPESPLLPEDLRSASDVLEAVERLPLVWRLDAIEACQDVLDA